jgi:glycosyltransferase involved in cell wall biosynthesis
VVRARHIVFGLPLNRWKRVLGIPLLMLLAAALSGRRVTVFLHEWTALHPLRRLVVMPFILLSDAVIALSPYIRNQIARDRWIAGAAGKCHLVPHPPTVSRPQVRVLTPLTRAVERAAVRCDVVVGHFGSIYRGKTSMALLDVCDRLRSRGIRALIVFIGGFTQSLDGYEQEFRAKVDELAIADQVIVTGYVASEAELCTLFDQIGVFLFLFAEGLTARRSSVIACLQSDRPVVVTAPRAPDEFAHHNGFAELIEAGALSFVPHDADPSAIAERLLAVAKQNRSSTPALEGDAWWRATIAATHAALRSPKRGQ